jgi:hypothetical protein
MPKPLKPTWSAARLRRNLMLRLIRVAVFTLFLFARVRRQMCRLVTISASFRDFIHACRRVTKW